MAIYGQGRGTGTGKVCHVIVVRSHIDCQPNSDGFKGRLRSVLFLTHRGCNLQQNQVSKISYCMMPLPWGTLALNHACIVMLCCRTFLHVLNWCSHISHFLCALLTNSQCMHVPNINCCYGNHIYLMSVHPRPSTGLLNDSYTTMMWSQIARLDTLSPMTIVAS